MLRHSRLIFFCLQQIIAESWDGKVETILFCNGPSLDSCDFDSCISDQFAEEFKVDWKEVNEQRNEIMLQQVSHAILDAEILLSNEDSKIFGFSTIKINS